MAKKFHLTPEGPGLCRAQTPTSSPVTFLEEERAGFYEALPRLEGALSSASSDELLQSLSLEARRLRLR